MFPGVVSQAIDVAREGATDPGSRVGRAQPESRQRPRTTAYGSVPYRASARASPQARGSVPGIYENDGYDSCPVEHFREGQRIELHPATDLWLAGARYGTVVP
jgi:hypothetical protein